ADEPAEEAWLDDRAEPEVDRPKKRRVFQALAIVGGLVALALTVGGGYALWRYKSLEPDRLHEMAHQEYKARQYQQARTHFEKLAADYPTHGHAPEARFFVQLCALQQAVGVVTVEENPDPALAEWDRFQKAIADPVLAPFAAKDRFGIDVYDAGLKLAEKAVAKAGREFDADKPEATEDWLAKAVTVEATTAQFQPDLPRDKGFAKSAAELQDKIAAARDRLARLDRVRQIKDPEERRNVAVEEGLLDDPAYRAMRRDDEQRIQAQARYTKEPQPRAPTPAPDDGLTSLLFAPAVGMPERRALAGPPGVFFALARGVLYVLDEADGRVLWAARTGLDMDVMPVHVRGNDLPGLALIATNTGDRFGLSARAAADGRPLWHQPLPAPVRGTPVVVGPNAYVALGDDAGTVVEINVTTGEAVGKITLGRPAGPQLAHRPGTGLLYIPADAAATYVFEVDARDQNGQRREPSLLGVMNTGQPTGSLRGTPVFSNPEPEDPGPKFLVLGQADGLESMKLRAFPVPADGKPDGGETAAEIGIGGWASFPPFCDGEKLAVVTDKGEFGLYGLALAKNPIDPAIFAFPPPDRAAGPGRPSRGQVVLADERTFWVLVGGSLCKLRFGLSGDEGVRVVAAGEPIPAGEPLHAPQVTPRGDVFVVVTQDGPACRATAVDSRTGRVRWRRDLGLVAKGDPVRIGDAVLLLDQGGALYRIEAPRLANLTGAAGLVDEKWTVFGPPTAGFTPITGLIRGPGDTAFSLLANDSPTDRKLLVRRYGPNGGKGENVFSVRAGLAGRPVVSGNFLILPLADGSLWRAPVDTLDRLEDGPSWRGERQPATVTCYLTPIDDDELFASDGGRAVRRWRWESKTRGFEPRGKIVLTDRVAATPAVLPGNRLVVADGTGAVTMWDGDKLAPPVLRAWRPGAPGGLPAGPITDGLHFVKDLNDQPRVLYAVNGQYAVLSPNSDAPKWVGSAPDRGVEGRPVIDAKQMILTDRAGVVRVLSMADGKASGAEYRITGSHAVAAAAVPLDAGRVLVPLADGTVVLGPLATGK
ncbi:MAG TPA: PQQ-binding-like beta-propeller repeat protein, partial [Gemmataceae bacterium]|nr:PQQ-binding-like beta-propeller repeat protein [Gemmataceae bacterium]